MNSRPLVGIAQHARQQPDRPGSHRHRRLCRSRGLVFRPPRQRSTVLESLGRLQAGGSTNGAQGIQLAYRIARESFIDGGVNRVVLATDGDFNVGVTNQGDLVRMIETNRDTGISLSVLGFGMGNLKDSTMEKLAVEEWQLPTSTARRAAKCRHRSGGTPALAGREAPGQFNPRTVSAPV